MKNTLGNLLLKKQKKEKLKVNLNSSISFLLTPQSNTLKIDTSNMNFDLSFPPRMTKEEIDEHEMDKDSFKKIEQNLFIKWIKNKKLLVYEKNFEVWRQFFIGIEQSDCIAQIVDARRIEFYLNLDIINEYKNKSHLILINKSDLLVKEKNEEIFDINNLIKNKETLEIVHKKCKWVFYSCNNPSNDLFNLINQFNSVSLVGYPNVGKSSTMNLLIGKTKFGVNHIPGKTKHIQTYKFNNTLLVDTPGLVFAKHDRIAFIIE